MKRNPLFSVLFVLAACTGTIPPDPVDVGFPYFPLEVGAFRTYEVDAIEYFLFQENDTNSYQLKEVVADTFSNGGELTYILHRFSRKDETVEWRLDSVWTARLTAQHAVVVENNVPFAKLTFPVSLNKIWDGNVFNTLAPDLYEITDISGAMQTPAGTFDNTLTVFENYDPDTLIFQDIRQAVYAQDVGLIYRMHSILDYCNTEPECLGILETGIKFEQLLIAYGKE